MTAVDLAALIPPTALDELVRQLQAACDAPAEPAEVVLRCSIRGGRVQRATTHREVWHAWRHTDAPLDAPPRKALDDVPAEGVEST